MDTAYNLYPKVMITIFSIIALGSALLGQPLGAITGLFFVWLWCYCAGYFEKPKDETLDDDSSDIETYISNWRNS